MKVHFIGIGGIGISALAQYYLSKGHTVTGSDLSFSEITEFLEKKGAKIYIGPHSGNNLDKDIDLVIFTPAINLASSEYKKAKNLKIKAKSYPEALGELTKKHFTIAVSGTHGKSTTTAMLSLVLIKAGLDPTVIIGTKLKEFGDTNFRMGNSKFLVIEADEYSASFLNYWPKIIILTNIEKEHLDYFKNTKNIFNTYKKYIRNLDKNGILVFNKDDKNIKKIINTKLPPRARIARLAAQAKRAKGGKTKSYTIAQKEAKNLRKTLQIPGEHNVSNALAILTTARTLDIPDKITFKAIGEYQGAWRRFEKIEILKPKKFTLISDYGHHPTEVLATLKAAREKYPKSEIWCIFQPHQYQRTYYLFNDFVKIFRAALIDNIIITDIYDVAGRETKKISSKISSKKLVEKIKKNNVSYLPPEKLENFIKSRIENGDVLIIMGAGDIYKLTHKF